MILEIEYWPLWGSLCCSLFLFMCLKLFMDKKISFKNEKRKRKIVGKKEQESCKCTREYQETNLIHIYRAQKTQNSTCIQWIWSQIIAASTHFHYYLKYWHSIKKFCKFRQKESIWKHSKRELHLRGSIWASCNQQRKWVCFKLIDYDYISNQSSCLFLLTFQKLNDEFKISALPGPTLAPLSLSAIFYHKFC